ncbi:MAG TPA: hypothetical protein PKN12_10190 [Bacteroidales bacterium]|nr:hypothetical protein [Bacteroidales bacterium]HPT10769.1 hypothetical protein [Bacteroidales bacterium]
MKRIINISPTKPFMAFVLFILLPVALYSQDYIILKTGKDVRVNFISQTPDSITYSKYKNPGDTCSIAIEEVDTLLSLEVLNCLDNPVSLKGELWRQKFYYQDMKRMGGGLLLSGTLITLASIGLYSLGIGVEGVYDEESDILFGPDLGFLLGVTAIIWGISDMIKGSIKLNKTEASIRELYLGLYGPGGQPGITMGIKF